MNLFVNKIDDRAPQQQAPQQQAPQQKYGWE